MSSLYHHLVSRLHLGDALWRFQKRGLYCFNFHRIGDWRETEFDPCVFSCNAEDLRSYLQFFKKDFSIVSLDEVSALVADDQPLKERLAFVTFDDGYRDNFTDALPVLKEEQVAATFFIPTSYIESSRISWWDEIAWHVRKMRGKQIRMSGWQEDVAIGRSDIRHDIRQVLNKVKASGIAVEEQVEELRRLSGDTLPDTSKKRLFMSWDELKVIIDAGMTIGAHSHSHEIFTNLSDEGLKFELMTSKRILVDELGVNVRSLSYPVGRSSSFRASMFDTIRDCGYDLAFSFVPAVNIHPTANRYQLARLSVDSAFNKSRMIAHCVSAKKL